jgi:hypothetical protein
MNASITDIGKVFLGSYARAAEHGDEGALSLLNSGHLVAGVPVLDASACYPYDELLESRVFVPADTLSVAEWNDWAGSFRRCADSYADHPGSVVRHVLRHTAESHQALYVVYADDAWVHATPDSDAVTGEDWRLLAFIETVPSLDGAPTRGRELAIIAVGDLLGGTDRVMRFRIEAPEQYADNPVVHPDLLASFQRLTDVLAERQTISFDPVHDTSQGILDLDPLRRAQGGVEDIEELAAEWVAAGPQMADTRPLSADEMTSAYLLYLSVQPPSTETAGAEE